MRGRITGLTVIIVLLFGLILGQAVFIQVHRANALNDSRLNPRNSQSGILYPRGEILSSNGTVLARSIKTTSTDYPYRRSYPLGNLVSDVVGYSSLHFGTGGIEYEYNGELVSHLQPARNFAQYVNPVRSANDVSLSLEVPLQQVAARALDGRIGAVVALDPRDGSIFSMYSNPTFNPAPLASTSYAIQNAAWKKYTTYGADHFQPIGNVATEETFPPGSTFKVVTTAGILRYYPALQYAYFPQTACLDMVPYGGSPLHPLCNSGGSACGGTITEMLPASCDPGYAWLGMKLGAKDLYQQATQFGYNAVPPLDIPGVAASYFPPVSYFTDSDALLGYSAIGQDNVRATALQDALVAAAVANGGKEMAPHFLRTITDSQGNVVETYKPWVWQHPIGHNDSAQITTLMHAVVTQGTASGVGFLYADDVAAKTGTAQVGVGNTNTDDWMIAFAPASHPVVAVAVVVPNQTLFDWGATVAGPIVKCVIEAQLALDAKQPPSGTATTCPA